MSWLIKTFSDGGVEIGDVLEPGAVDLLAARLRTPLQIDQHLTLALETDLQANEKPLSDSDRRFRAIDADRRCRGNA